ncbi:MAG: GNAT family N-acetyltransferase [Caulobacteraceae bacterium]
MSLAIRRFAADEADLFRQIRLEALATSPETFAMTHAEELKRAPTFYADHLSLWPVWGVFHGAVPVGMAGLNRNTGVKIEHKGVLWGMFLAAAHRGSGAAAGLIEAVLAGARAMGLRQVHLTCAETNPRALALYRRLGFVQYGLEPGALHQPDGAFVNDVLMVRTL